MWTAGRHLASYYNPQLTMKILGAWWEYMKKIVMLRVHVTKASPQDADTKKVSQRGLDGYVPN